MKDYKWYGHFNADDSFTVTEPETPRHWYNYMFNDEYVTFTSQVGYGEGLAQDDMGRRILLVSNRNIFVSENGGTWSLFGLPLDYGYTDYSCTAAASVPFLFHITESKARCASLSPMRAGGRFGA